MDEEKRETPFLPVSFQHTLSIPAPIDEPEKIVRDILTTEKELMAETLRLLRGRHEREKVQWDRLYSEKEREKLCLKDQLCDAEKRLRQMQQQCEEERHYRIEQINKTAQELEARRRAEQKKWEAIAGEVKSFRDAALAAQGKLLAEQEGVQQIRKRAAEEEGRLREQLSNSEDEVLHLKEQLVAKEEGWLKTLTAKDEEIHVLQEQVGAIQKILDEERRYLGRRTESKDLDLGRVQKALQDTIIQLNTERQAGRQQEEKIQELETRISHLTEDLKKKDDTFAEERSGLLRTVQEEQANWERYKKEFEAKEESSGKETEEQVQRILKSVAIIEQQLADEQKLRAELEGKLGQKDQELQALGIQKDELVREWQGILANERSAWQLRQTEIAAELDKIRQNRDNETAALRQELAGVTAALNEEKKLFGFEREGNGLLQSKVKELEEAKRRAAEQLKTKEKEWREVLQAEQALFRRQMEEAKKSTEAQVLARDGEIARLDEDINLLNGYILELKQKLALEKNENNNRLDRIQDFEAQLKNVTGRYNQERVEWMKKVQFTQDLWDEQKRGMETYQKELESRYQKDVKELQEKMQTLSEQLKKNTSPGPLSIISIVDNGQNKKAV